MPNGQDSGHFGLDLSHDEDSPTAERISYSDVLPLQPACPHEQSMSGVFSIASHWVLQYLPDVVTHEQTGCTLLGFRSRHFFSPSLGSKAIDSRRYLRQWEKALPCKKEHISIWVTEWQPQMWMVIRGGRVQSCRFSANDCDGIQLAQRSLETLDCECVC
jgi:hypothetical protein